MNIPRPCFDFVYNPPKSIWVKVFIKTVQRIQPQICCTIMRANKPQIKNLPQGNYERDLVRAIIPPFPSIISLGKAVTLFIRIHRSIMHLFVELRYQCFLVCN